MLMSIRQSLIFGAVALSTAAFGVTGAIKATAAELLTIDESEGSVKGWAIGYSRGFAGCLGYSRFTDETTVWFGYSTKQQYFIAMTNPKWYALKPGRNYRLQVRMRRYGNWNGLFLAFMRKGEKGVFIGKLKREFMRQFAWAPGFHIYAAGTRMAGLSLHGSKAALASVEQCFEDRRFQAARDAEEAERRKRYRPSPGRETNVPPARDETPPGPKVGHNNQGGGGPQPRRPVQTSSGTGFFVSSKGHLLTNNHVINGCTNIKVGYSGGLLEGAKLMATDKRNDLALLRTELRGESLPALKSRVRVGDNIYVYGFPLSGLLSKTGNFTVGYITSAAGLNDDTSQFQISAPVQPGNSGGPLVDRSGNVVGVIVSKLNVLRVAKFIKDVPQNVNFAIKASIAANFLESNGVAIPANESQEKLEPAEIAERSKKFTVRVICTRE
jgi:serine protease Do